MPRCQVCQKRILTGAVKDPVTKSVYCSAGCRLVEFSKPFLQTLAEERVRNPTPIAAPTAQPTSGQFSDRDGFYEEFLDDSASRDHQKDYWVNVVGLGFAIAVAMMTAVATKNSQVYFFTIMAKGVIPLAAGVYGMIAGLGYWAMLRIMDRRPNRFTLIMATTGGAATFFLTYIVIWRITEIQGVKIHQVVGFWDYFQVAIEQQRVNIGGGAAVAAGKLGYVRFFLNMLGFVLGLNLTVKWIWNKTYCEACRRYLQKGGRQIRKTSDPVAAALALHPVMYAMERGWIQEAINLHAKSAAPHAKGFLTTTLSVESCPGCQTQVAVFKGAIPGDQNTPSEVPNLTFQTTCRHPVRFPEHQDMNFDD